MNFRRCEMQINHTELLVCGYSRHYLFATYLFCIDQTQCWDKELPTNLTKKDIWNIRMHARSWHSSPSIANCKAYRRLPGSMDHQKHKLAWDPGFEDVGWGVRDQYLPWKHPLISFIHCQYLGDLFQQISHSGGCSWALVRFSGVWWHIKSPSDSD